MKRLSRLMTVVAALSVPTLSSAAPIVVDWEDGTWTHGVNNFVGWRRPTTQPAAGTGVYSGTTSGGNVTVEWRRFGTATGTHGSLGGGQPGVSTTFNGLQTDGALSVGTGGDANATSLNNYVRLSILFSGLVTLNPFTIGDVDDIGGAAWQDFVAVTGSNGTVSPSYSLTNATNQLATTRFGFAGVLGRNNSDANGASDNANVTVSFAQPVNRLDLYFFQGPQGTSGSSHGIWLTDLSGTLNSPVPEPGTAALLGAPLIALGLFARRRKK